MAKKIPRNVWLTGLTSLFTDISSEMVYPLIPIYLTAMGAGAQVLGVIEGIAESTASLLKVFSGTISDWLGRRKFLAIFGYSFSALGKLLLYIAGSWKGVLLGRVADRFGKGIRTAPRDSIIAESVTEDIRGKAFGLHRAMDTLGAFIGVSLAIIISLYFHSLQSSVEMSRILFVVKKILLASLIPAFIGVIFLFFVKETGRASKDSSDEKKTSSKPNITIPMLIKAFGELPGKLKAFLVLVFLFSLGNSSNMFLIKRASDVLEVSMPSLTVVGPLVLYWLFNATHMLVSYPAGVLSDKIGRKWILVVGYVVYSLVYFGFAFSENPYAYIVLFLIYGVYMGLTEGVEKALVADLSSQELRATVLGLHATLVGIGLLPASALAGFLYRINPAYAFSVGGVFSLAAAIGMIFIL